MSKDDETASLAAQSREVWEQGAEMMWRNILADTVLMLLERDGQLNRDSLRDAVSEGIADASKTRIERATFQGALKALDGRPPAG